MKLTSTRASLASLVIAITAAALAAPSGGPVNDLTWHTVDGGGGRSTGANLIVDGTIGQPDPGRATGGVWTLDGGFWPGAGAGGGVTPPCPGDADGSGEVAFGDLLAVLAAWGPCPGCPEDFNDDDVVDFSDLLAVLSAWGPCP